jgi:dTDP-4-amino-4,6-dideoxygalactose transaminase
MSQYHPKESTLRNEYLPFALPDVDVSEFNRITEALCSGWVTTGPKTRQFEADFAATVGAKHAIAVNSCTAAMHLALEAIGLQRGDEVITTPYTFAATAEVVRYFDAKPVLVDVCADTFNIDPSQIATAITAKTKAIIPVHMAGLPADLDAIAAIAQKHDLAVIEDAAHAFPTKYKGRMIGAPLHSQQSTNHESRFTNHATCFSFYATKTITTGEGGMICTDNDAIADRCRIMALHGISRDAWKRYTAEGSWYYEITAPGYKYNLTDVAAAMGLAQLAKAERMWQRRVEIAQRYTAAFSQFEELQVPTDNPVHQHAWHLYMLRLNLEHFATPNVPLHNVNGAAGIRADFVEELKQRKIGVSVHFIPLHLHPYYRESYRYSPEDFPVAYREYQREISLPIYSKMSDQDVEDVINAVCAVVKSKRMKRYAILS